MIIGSEAGALGLGLRKRDLVSAPERTYSGSPSSSPMPCCFVGCLNLHEFSYLQQPFFQWQHTESRLSAATSPGLLFARCSAAELPLVLGAALVLRGDTNEALGDAAPRRKPRRSCGNEDAPPGSSEPELPGGTGGRPKRPTARGVDELLGQGGTASLQELPPPGSSLGSSCVAMVTIPRRNMPPSGPLEIGRAHV